MHSPAQTGEPSHTLPPDSHSWTRGAGVFWEPGDRARSLETPTPARGWSPVGTFVSPLSAWGCQCQCFHARGVRDTDCLSHGGDRWRTHATRVGPGAGRAAIHTTLGTFRGRPHVPGWPSGRPGPGTCVARADLVHQTAVTTRP